MRAIRRSRAPLPSLFGQAARRRRALWVLVAVTLAFGLAQLPELGTMDDRGAGIIAFELAGSSARAHEIVTGWGSAGRSAAQLSLALDYGYLLGYGLLLAGACTAVAERFRLLGAERLAAVGVLFAWGALAAAGADALENVALLVVSGGRTSQPWPGLAAGFASLKFALSAAALGFALLGWIAALVRGRARAA